MRHTMVLATYI